MVPDHIRDQKVVKEDHVALPKQKIDDETSSKTHLAQFMHNVVSSKFKTLSFMSSLNGKKNMPVTPVITTFMTYTVVSTNPRNQM